MFLLGFSNPLPITYTYYVKVIGGGGSLNTNFADVRGVGGYYFADQSGQGGREGGINRFFCGRPLWMVP